MATVAERWRTNSDVLLVVFDLTGTLVFALEGALRAIRSELDFLGVLVLAFVTAVGGGIIRDLLIGATPPAAIRDWRYFGVAILGATAVTFFYQWVQANLDIVQLDVQQLAKDSSSGAPLSTIRQDIETLHADTRQLLLVEHAFSDDTIRDAR